MTDDAPRQAPQGGQIPAEPPRPPRRGAGFWVLVIAVILAGAGVAAWYLLPWRAWVSTDDAFVEGHIAQVSPLVPGRVLRVLISDNQNVAQGQLLVELDPQDYQARVDQARASLNLSRSRLAAARSAVELSRATSAASIEQAKADVESARARVAQAEADAVAADAEAVRTAADLARYEKVDERAVSRQQRDLARASAEAARARLDAARKRVTAAQADVSAAEARLAAANATPFQVAVAEADVQRYSAEIEQAQAALALAELQLSYTKIVAPSAGRVTRKSVEPGNYVQPGQTLTMLVGPDLWVVANYKESQLEEMKPGQPVRIEVDAFPGVVFRGHVDSIQAGSGSRFSLLPPENATGNYVKIVQRVPVKIVFDTPPDSDRYHMGPGMSVVPEVKIR